MTDLSRRSFLTGSAVAAVAGFSGVFGYTQVFAQGDGDTPQTILDLAATAETFACTHYYNAIMSADALKLTATEIRDLKTFLDAELKHKLFLEANGAKALATEFYVPATLFTDRALFIATSNTAENWFIAAYLAATRRFAELNQPLLAATTAQVMGVEAEHQALLRQMGGLVASPSALKAPLFYNTSEVAPLFQPFLDGKADGFVGPAKFPGADAINELVGDDTTTPGVAFITLTSGQGSMAMEDTSMSGTGDCMVSSSNTNIRADASTSSDVVGKLTDGKDTPVTARKIDGNGYTWLKIEQGWVRADVVKVSGNCMALAAS